jgi:hypothetical protein
LTKYLSYVKRDPSNLTMGDKEPPVGISIARDEIIALGLII